jgi:hypothetical protein
MGCNSCKSKNNLKDGIEISEQGKDMSLVLRGIQLFVKTVLFIICGGILSVVVIPFSLYTLYKILFHGSSIDVSGALKLIASKIKKPEETDDEEAESGDEIVIHEVEDIN